MRDAVFCSAPNTPAQLLCVAQELGESQILAAKRGCKLSGRAFNAL
jgi:hypothetical protein